MAYLGPPSKIVSFGSVGGGGSAGGLVSKGTISLPAEFPTSGTPQVGWLYEITADVTDNDPTKTNTLQSFITGAWIFWNGVNWTQSDSNVMHLTGNESATGTKTFTDVRSAGIAVGWAGTNVPLLFEIRSSTYTGGYTDPTTFGEYTQWGTSGLVMIGYTDTLIHSGSFLGGDIRNAGGLAFAPLQLFGTKNFGSVGSTERLIDFANAFSPVNTMLGNGYVGIKNLIPLSVLHAKDTNPKTIMESTQTSFADGDKATFYSGYGKTSGGTLHELGNIKFCHYGPLDDQKGTLIANMNDGNDGLAPSLQYDLIQPQRDITYVDSLADLPAQVGGKITLESKTYHINVPQLLMPYTLVPPANQVCNIQGNVIVHVGATGTPLIQNRELEDGTLFLRQIVLANAGHPSNTIFDIGADTNPTTKGIVLMKDTRFIGFNDMGVIDDVGAKSESFDLESIGGNLTLNDNLLISFTSVNARLLQSVAKDVFKLSGNIGSVQFTGVNFVQKVSGQYLFNFDSALKTDSAIITGTTPTLLSNGGIFNPAGIDEQNPQLTVKANSFISSSRVLYEATSKGNTVATTNVVQDADHIPSLDVSVTSKNEQRVRIDSDFRINYFGLEKTTLKSDAILNIRSTLGGDKSIESQFARGFNESLRVDINTTTSVITKTGHGLSNGNTVFIDNFLGTLAPALTRYTPYYVISATTDTFQVSATLGGVALSLAGTVGNLNFYSIANVFTVDAGTDRIQRTAHGLSNGDRIIIKNPGAVGLRNDIIYHVLSVTANDFQVEETSGGGAVDITGAVPTNAYYHEAELQFEGFRIKVQNLSLTANPGAPSFNVKTGDFGFIILRNTTDGSDMYLEDASAYSRD